jgi:hypothetical protein
MTHTHPVSALNHKWSLGTVRRLNSGSGSEVSSWVGKKNELDVQCIVEPSCDTGINARHKVGGADQTGRLGKLGQ